MKLSTPFGEISILIDDIEIEYSFKKLKAFKNCPNVDGRYIIEIDFKPDGKEHNISCVFEMGLKDMETDFESGENLECQAFCFNDIKMSIGLEGDNWYDPDTNKRESNFDFDVDYLNNGISNITFYKNRKISFWIVMDTAL